jgi:triosephosphate isomerase
MKNRSRLVIGNWKMHLAPGEAAAFVDAFRKELPSLPPAVGVGLAPAFPALERVGKAIAGTRILLAAQDVHHETKGAFTGEVSAPMLKDLGVTHALVGHSERRRLRGERESVLAKKMARLAEAGIAPVYCVGETLEEREGGETPKILARQMTAFDGASAPPPGLVLAYEPVWAIGTGRAATPEMAAEAHSAIRALLAARWGEAAARALQILYGGSVTAANAANLFAQQELDGGLVGGASLDAAGFAAIVRAAA